MPPLTLTTPHKHHHITTTTILRTDLDDFSTPTDDDVTGAGAGGSHGDSQGRDTTTARVMVRSGNVALVRCDPPRGHPRPLVTYQRLFNNGSTTETHDGQYNCVCVRRGCAICLCAEYMCAVYVCVRCV